MQHGNRLILGQPPPDRAREALRFVLSDLGEDERNERLAAWLSDPPADGVSLAGLLEARRRGELVGAMLSQIDAGRTALVWPPRLVPGEPESTAEKLLALDSQRLTRESVFSAHALLATVTAASDAALRRAGYAPQGELFYLVCRRPDREETGEPPDVLDYEPYTAAIHERFARLVEATYEETLDRLGLHDGRGIDDVLAGYRAVGRASDTLWWIARHKGRDVGCLLVADHPEQDAVELTYMGLVVSARGNGWGGLMTRRARQLAWKLGRGRLILAVDAGNHPALRAYRRVGFDVWQQRRVWWRRFARADKT